MTTQSSLEEAHTVLGTAKRHARLLRAQEKLLDAQADAAREGTPAKEKPTPALKPGQVVKKQAELLHTLESIVRQEIKVEEQKRRVDANFRAQLTGLYEQKKKALESMDNLNRPLPLLDGLPPADNPEEAKPKPTAPTDGFGRPLIPGKRRGRPKKVKSDD